jgi:hypothetical protein
LQEQAIASIDRLTDNEIPSLHGEERRLSKIFASSKLNTRELLNGIRGAPMDRYQDVYPSSALLRSFDVVRPRAGDLMTLEYFEAEPGRMPDRAFAQHHILLNLNPVPHRVENWRSTGRRDFTFSQNEVVITPAGTINGWHWHAKSKVIEPPWDCRRPFGFSYAAMGTSSSLA